MSPSSGPAKAKPNAMENADIILNIYILFIYIINFYVQFILLL